MRGQPLTGTADHVVGIAQAIHWADRHLDALLANPSIASDPLAAFGSSVSSIFLRAFATELALKALYMQEASSEPVRDHDLKVMFESLESGTQASVEQRFERIRQTKVSQGVYSGETDPLLQVLSNHKDDFERWRYPHEHAAAGLNTRPTVLNSVIEAALEEFVTRA